MAVVCVAVALLLRWLVDPWLGPTVPYLSFFPAVLIASWFGGFGPGLLAAGLSAAASSYVWFLLPVGLLKMSRGLRPALHRPVHDHRGRHRLPGRRDEKGRSVGAPRGGRVAHHAGQHRRRRHRHRHGGARPVPQRRRGAPDGLDDDRGAGAAARRDLRDRQRGSPSSRSRTWCVACCAKGAPIGLANHTILKHRQGRWRPIADSGAPVRNDEGEIDGVVLVFRDQTAERDAGRQLRRSQSLLQAISDKSPTVTYVKDLDGRYLFVNQSFLDLFHITQEEILGRTDIDRFGAEIAERFRSMDRRVVEANGPLTEEELVPVDGGERTYLSVKCPLWDEAGKPYAVFGVSTDITDRKRIEGALVESRQHYQAMAESLPHLVWTCRADGYCDYLSRQWVGVHGPLGRGAARRAAGRRRCTPTTARASRSSGGWRCQRGDLYDEEFRLRRHDGAYRWFRTRGVPLRDATRHARQVVRLEHRCRGLQAVRAAAARTARADGSARPADARDRRTPGSHGVLRVVVRSLEDHLPLDYCCACLYDAVDRTAVGGLHRSARRGARARARARRRGDGARRRQRPREVPPRSARLRTRHQRGTNAVRPAARRRRHPLVRRRAARRREQRVRRAHRRAAGRRRLHQPRLRVPPPAQRTRRRSPRTRRSSTPRCSAPTTICGRRSRR